MVLTKAEQYLETEKIPTNWQIQAKAAAGKRLQPSCRAIDAEGCHGVGNAGGSFSPALRVAPAKPRTLFK